jgi:hypothetical protein
MAKFLTKLFGFIGQERNATMPFETWNCLITDRVVDNIVQHTNQYILITQPNFSHESDAKLIDKIENKTFIDLFCLAGALRSNMQSLKELWGIEEGKIKKFRLMVNQRHFKLLIRCVLE